MVAGSERPFVLGESFDVHVYHTVFSPLDIEIWFA